jgi:hypothetical protein
MDVHALNRLSTKTGGVGRSGGVDIRPIDSRTSSYNLTKLQEAAWMYKLKKHANSG